jgi:hypothetical protein
MFSLFEQRIDRSVRTTRVQETTELADVWPSADCVDACDRRRELWRTVFARTSMKSLFGQIDE